MKFLIVDDDIIARMTLSSMLKDYGDSQEVAGAEELMMLIEQLSEPHKQFDAILLDVRMPKIDGLECLNLIRQHEMSKGILPGEGFKVIMVTSDTADETVKGSFKNQCDGYLAKPVDRQKLANALKMAEIIP